MDLALRTSLLAGLHDGSVIPYLGPGVLEDVKHAVTGAPMPATSDQLILAMNGGKPMAPKLMYEFSRAAMNVELKRGRNAVTRFLTDTYGDRAWSPARLHCWLAGFTPRYVIDTNRDTQLIDRYAGIPHILILGCARIGGASNRFIVYRHDGHDYHPATEEQITGDVPIIFKPTGCPRPHPSYIASDADYVDYITELMGGFAIPPFLKTLRKGKRYLLLGMRLTRDTARMLLSDIIYDAAPTPRGWAFIAEATPKERRFLDRIGLTLIEEDCMKILDGES